LDGADRLTRLLERCWRRVEHKLTVLICGCVRVGAILVTIQGHFGEEDRRGETRERDSAGGDCWRGEGEKCRRGPQLLILAAHSFLCSGKAAA
jgi:hypothetical protein